MSRRVVTDQRDEPDACRQQAGHGRGGPAARHAETGATRLAKCGPAGRHQSHPFGGRRGCPFRRAMRAPVGLASDRGRWRIKALLERGNAAAGRLSCASNWDVVLGPSVGRHSAV